MFAVRIPRPVWFLVRNATIPPQDGGTWWFGAPPVGICRAPHYRHGRGEERLKVPHISWLLGAADTASFVGVGPVAEKSHSQRARERSHTGR